MVVETFADVAEVIMGQSPPGSTVSAEGEIPLLNGPTEFGPSHPKPTQYTSEGRKFAEPGDLLFCVRGSTTGRMNWADQRYAIGRGVAAIRHRADPALQSIVRATLEHKLPELLAQATGSTFPNVSSQQLSSLPWPTLDLSDQYSAAQFLGAIAERVELNRRMCETLETIARTLFKSWFIDFDPVRTKGTGCEVSMPAHLADLFSDRLGDSQMGPIPRGWSIRTLGEIAEMTMGRSYRSSELSESETALVTLKSFKRGGGYRSDGLKPYIGEYKPEQVVHTGDVIVSCTDVTQSADVVGRAAIVPPTQAFRRLVASLDVLIVRPSHAAITQAFLYLLMSTSAFVAHTNSHATGTTVLHLDKAAVPSYQFACPPMELIRLFGSIVSPLLAQIQLNHQNSELLTATRDYLLPKLISAKIKLE